MTLFFKNNALKVDTIVFANSVDCSNNVALKTDTSFVSNIYDDVVVNLKINGHTVSKYSPPKQVKQTAIYTRTCGKKI